MFVRIANIKSGNWVGILHRNAHNHTVTQYKTNLCSFTQSVSCLMLVLCVSYFPFGYFELLHSENLPFQSRKSIKALETVRSPNPGFSHFHMCFTLPNYFQYSAKPSPSHQAKDINRFLKCLSKRKTI